MCMEFVAAGLCKRNWLRLGQTIRDSGDLGVPLVSNPPGVAGSKNIRVVYLLDLFEGRGENGHCDFVCGEGRGENGH